MIPYSDWLTQIGRSKTTGWRWVSRGWITPMNISGRLYVSSEAIEQFRARAETGAFSKKPSGAAAAAANIRNDNVCDDNASVNG